MQPQPILVETFDRGKALDVMARLDYSSRYIFDYDIPNMRVFGRVDGNYHATLFAHLHLVWGMMSGRQNPSTEPSQRISSTASTAGSTTTITPARNPGGSTAGPISNEAMLGIISQLRDYAEEHDLPQASQLPAADIQALAASQAKRAIYITRVKEMWRKSRQRDDEDEEDE